ncbi:MAG: penicillin acylase family protein [Myxococcales bacterium]|nr:penicillin acylase family protein [Myxococcales bacterium]
MKYIFRALVALAYSVVFLTVCGTFVVIAGLYTTLPKVNGEDIVHHLLDEASILRDAHGVPHILAQSQSDAYFSLGYTHAQDRFWQMHLTRMIASGRLSEIFGAKALPADEITRVLGRPEQARQAMADLKADERALIESYVAGVNAYLTSSFYRTAPEFFVSWSTPHSWSVLDTMLVSTFFNYLGNTYRDELRSLYLEYTGGSTLAESFHRPYPSDGRVALHITDLVATMGPSILRNQTNTSTPTSTTNELTEHSNNYVISGKRSASGAPLLANDPHLRLSTPGFWYLAHLHYGNQDIIGATFPGLPFIILGHNQHIAWGFTTTAADIEDIIIEQIHPNNPDQYQTQNGWETFQTRKEIFTIRGGSPITRTYRTSRNGRILPDHLLPHLHKGLHPPTDVVLAYRSTANIPPNHSARFFNELNAAQTWDDAVSAASHSAIPPHNMVFASSNGDIGYIMLGKIPVRADNYPAQGSHPVYGKDPRNAWEGVIQPNDMPKVLNPQTGFIVTANGRIVPQEYNQVITATWKNPGRGDVIEQRILAQEKHTLDSLTSIQLDVSSKRVWDILPILLATNPQSKRDARALALLAEWDGVYDRQAPQPAIYHAFLATLTDNIYQDELKTAFGAVRNRFPQVVIDAFKGKLNWCDDIRTIKRLESCEDWLAPSLHQALDGLAHYYGEDYASWAWGQQLTINHQHLAFGNIPIIGRFFSSETPGWGGPSTPNVAKISTPALPQVVASNHGPSLRYIIDLSTPDQTRWITSSGQSGHLWSAHYTDLQKFWSDGQYILIPSHPSPSDIVARLKLQPSNRETPEP